MNKKVFIVPGFMEDAYRQLFAEIGYDSVDVIADADILVFGGGADIGPELYDQEPHPRTHPNPYRDAYEVKYYREAVAANKQIVGVCRGAQLINVLNGGSMYQHVTGHTGSPHSILDLETNEMHICNTVHHQMMRPPEGAKIVAVATQMGKKEYMEGNGIIVVTDDLEDPEVVWFPHTKSLCFQGHPEFGHAQTTKYFYELIKRFF